MRRSPSFPSRSPRPSSVRASACSTCANAIITGKAKFENLARMYSQDPGTMMRGGEMDPPTLERLEAPHSATALENMKPGQISEVVESQLRTSTSSSLLDKRGRLYHFRHILLRPVYTMDELDAGSLDTLDSHRQP
ncbi:MAG: peptidylprolyl isomerase [Alistipes shahii]